MLTLAEENYIKCIFKLSNGGTKNVLTNEIADKLQTKPASVSDMLKKLHQKDLLLYEKYYGVTLTKRGVLRAALVVRKHRIWEVFLVEKLQFKWDEVHDVAEQLEHINSDLLIDRLDAFLGFPKFDPHGGAIPDSNGKWSDDISFPLSKGKAGVTYVVRRVEGPDGLLRHLDEIGIGIGTNVTVVKKRDFDQLTEIKIDNKKVELLSQMVADSLLVE